MTQTPSFTKPPISHNLYTKILLQIIEQNPSDRQTFLALKKSLCLKEHLPDPKNEVFIQLYRDLATRHRIPEGAVFEAFLKKRQVRTQSGIACITVITKQYRCPGRCVFCPSVGGMPKSYLPDEPAMMRAILNHFDPYQQVQMRLEALGKNGHSTEKIEIRIAGETWSAYPKRYQTWFIKRIFDALNGDKSRTLLDAQKKNETTLHRCVGMSIETRPDWISIPEIRRLRKLGVTLVELGVQHLDDTVLDLNHRDHHTNATILATQLLRDAGFKILYHTMPNLIGSTPSMDLAMHRQLFQDENYQPDQLKIYPCMLLKNTLLYHWYQQGKYQPYSTETLIGLLLDIKKIVPPYVRIVRMIRDIPSNNIMAGNTIINLRQVLQHHPKFQCVCIRCREPRNTFIHREKIQMTCFSYHAHHGKEYFIAFETDDKKTILGFVRLRLPPRGKKHFLPELQDSALIRELHVYGPVVPLSQTQEIAVQHHGLGQKLMHEAEKIARESGYHTIAVISGIGVRQYYQNKLGYHLKGTYMVKNLS